VAEAQVVIQSVRKGFLTKDDQRRLYEFLREKLRRGEAT
jgi:hypothetical protein